MTFRNIFKTKPLFDFQERIKRDCDIKTKEIEEKVAILNTLISHVDERYKDYKVANYNNSFELPELVNLFRNFAIIKIIITDGKPKAKLASTPPNTPKVLKPAKVDMFMPIGPGVDSETAIMSAMSA